MENPPAKSDQDFLAYVEFTAPRLTAWHKKKKGVGGFTPKPAYSLTVA
jgi:hypothetical protein